MPDTSSNCAGTATHGLGHLLNCMTNAPHHARSDLVDATGSLRGAVTDAAGDCLGSVANALGDAGDSVANAPGGLGGGVSDALPDISDSFTDLRRDRAGVKWRVTSAFGLLGPGSWCMRDAVDVAGNGMCVWVGGREGRFVPHEAIYIRLVDHPPVVSIPTNGGN